ncbi:unnamed protein product [Thelazia callipaeda]|uniref:NUDE_C domain-containing protein n=1 Tax=Thelazia callipaeda TaxID=103827 RepID=A0A0N5CRP1_THECL|nr:unnamed protein product [Thelazia callipaeda]
MDWENLAKQYRTEAERCKQEADEAKSELKDFVIFSRQIEAELDRELNVANLSLSKREKEIASLVQERDRYKEESQRSRSEQYSNDIKLNNELLKLKVEREHLQKTVHKLEQKNDDLERELRITYETLKDTEKKLNEELEIRALLTTELDCKEDLKIRCQRLEDEVRDLKLNSIVKDGKLLNQQSYKKWNGVSVTYDKQNCGNFVQLKSYDGSVQDIGRKNSSSEIHSKGVGSRVNALPTSLASSVSPVIVNLLETIQALEEKLLLLHPERRAREDRFGPINQH